jgi:hypothetical protein
MFQPKRVRIVLLVLTLVLLFLALVGFPARSVSFLQSTRDLDAYDFVEITAQVAAPHAMNPFTGGEIRGTFESQSTHEHWQVDGFCDAGNYCLAFPDEIYAVYLPRAGSVNVHLPPGTYSAVFWNAATGEQSPLPPIHSTTSNWTSPAAPGKGDWALLLKKS